MVRELVKKNHESCWFAYNDGKTKLGCTCKEIIFLYREIHPERVFKTRTTDYASLTSPENCYFCGNHTNEEDRGVHMLNISEASERIGVHMLNISEASERIGVHPNTLRRWSDENRIKTYKINRRGDRRFDEGDIKRFIISYSSKR